MDREERKTEGMEGQGNLLHRFKGYRHRCCNLHEYFYLGICSSVFEYWGLIMLQAGLDV